MNISTVNELIASLESAGELSIREQKFLKLAKAFKQLASENVALKSAITDHSHSVHFCEVCGKDDPCSTDDVCYALKDIPATDAYLAGIKADGVEAFAAYCGEENSIFVEAKAYYRSLPDAAAEFCSMLREGADK
ncbi:Phage protein [Klebsiella pneumoniae]